MATKKEIFLRDLGLHIRMLRLKRNLTQFDLACLVNKDRQSIQRLEAGKVNPSIYYLFELAEGFEVDLKTLTNFTSTKNKKDK